MFQKEFFLKLNKNWLFEYLIILAYILFAMIGWAYSFTIAGVGIVLMSLALIVIFNDFKYLIPAILAIIFSNNGGFDSSSFPMQLAIYAGLLVVVALFYTIYNFKLSNFKRPKSYLGLIGLAISTILPIFWNNIIPDENWMMYFVYFGWLFFLLLYFVFGINFTKGSLRTVIFTFSALTLLLCFQVVFQIIKLQLDNPGVNIFDLDLSKGYTVGWGLCNEAGIMLCFFIPFVFIELVKAKNIFVIIFNVIKVGIIGLSIFLTTSRGALLIGSLEILILFIILLIYSKRRIISLISFLCLIAVGVTFVGLVFGFDKIFTDLGSIFDKGLGDNGRKELYDMAIGHFKENGLNMILGSGMVSDLQERFTYNHWNIVYIVYHSTFFEEMVAGGIVGLLCLAFHFFEKYKQLFKREKVFTIIMLVGYIGVDGYGMVDNTYGMYYYMIPLIMLMVALDIDNDTDIYNNENKELLAN